MMEILGNKNSIIENPISVDNIVDIYISYSTTLYKSFTGSVTFRKNNTTLKQNFKGDSLSNVYLQIYNFCNSL